METTDDLKQSDLGKLEAMEVYHFIYFSACNLEVSSLSISL